MSTIDALLDAAKDAVKASNDTELAKALGIRPAAVSNYRRGVSLPNAVVCATLAGLTGEPLAKVLGIVGEERAISSDEKAVWRKLAATAAILLCAIGLAGNPDTARASVGDQRGESSGMYIMLNRIAARLRSWLGSCLRWWLASLTDSRRNPKDTELQA